MNLRLLFFQLLFIGISGLATAQNCIPDQFYADSVAGVYPRPLSDLYPDAGIQAPACIGEPYTFNFTIKLTDTVTIGAIKLAINSIRLRADTPVIGLPSGISYRCEPPSCEVPANSLGCIELFGTPEASNIPGQYPLEIHAELLTNFGVIPIEFPDANISPGTYTLTLGDENGPDECITLSTHSPYVKTFPLEVYPSFGHGFAMIYLPELKNNSANFFISDIMGKTILKREIFKISGNQTSAIDISHYPAGTYIIQLQDGNLTYRTKYIKW
ncbi:MAG: T9SS type A sorting domain-containing protein [Saprospiraceae bacterium]|nr:T9SS type A sorting domain-containing protein [Saprospiraceae bacterium]